MTPLSIVVITGQSGSGKTTAIHALEDQDFLCVDNIPVSLVPNLIATVRGEGATERLAIVIDIRQHHLADEAPDLILRLRENEAAISLVYLEAREEALLRRYSETRRRHPLDQGQGLTSSIVRERDLLAPLRELADDTIDTSDLTPHELRGTMLRQVAHTEVGADLSLALMSFGFKYGLPLTADMVLDVRFLPNPYFVAGLREKNGTMDPVRDYVMGSPAVTRFLEEAHRFIDFLLPQFQAEGKRYLTLAIGCTGGRHRSVAMVEALAGHMEANRLVTHVRHRDLAKANSPEVVA